MIAINSALGALVFLVAARNDEERTLRKLDNPEEEERKE